MVRESWRKTGRCRCWWRYRKNLGTKNTPTVRQGPCRLSCKTCMAAVTLFPPATHDAATTTATLIARATWRKTDCCCCLWSQRNNSVRKKILPRYSWVRVDLQDTHVDGVRSSLVDLRRSQRPGADSADQLFTVDPQLCKSAPDCTSRLNSWDWVLVQVHRASSVSLWATIRMPTTIAISRKRSFMHDQRRQDGRSCKDAGCLRRLLPRHCNDNTASVG